ncbi:MAG: hypothetical protein JNK15_05430, partial [Planctomycetes bacterium]|nr:hypothetical protein [Planctomycetota bacterium]
MRSFAAKSFPFFTLTTLLLCAPLAPAQDDKKPVETTAGAGEAAAKEKPKLPFLRPSGRYEDLAEAGFDPTSLLTGGAGAPPKPFFEFLAHVDGLAKVEQTEILLDLSQPAAFSLPQLREIERALARVRAAGKKLTCYLENVSPVTYQIA